MSDKKLLQLYILNGIFFTIMQNLYKSFAVKFLERIGGTPFHISLYNAVPGFIAACIALPGALWLHRSYSRILENGIFVASRICIGLFALVPLAPLSWQPMLFIILIGIMNLPDSIAQMITQEMPARYFSDHQRSSAIAKRNKFSVPALLIVTLTCGQILSYFPKTETQRIHIYQAFFLLSFLFGIAEILSFSKLNQSIDPPLKTKISSSIKTLLKKILKNKPFILYLCCSLLFHFGWQMGWSLFSIYQIHVLGANEWWVGLISISSSIAMFFSYGFWAKKIRIHGNTPILGIVTLGMSITPLLYILSHTLYAITCFSLITGFFTSGTITVLQNTLLEILPKENRFLYIGVYQTFIYLSLMIAPMIGHHFLQIKNIVFALIMCAIFRAIGSISFIIRYRILKCRSI